MDALLMDNLEVIRDAVTDLDAWLADPDMDAVPEESRESVAFAWGYLQSAADAANMTLLQLAEESK